MVYFKGLSDIDEALLGLLISGPYFLQLEVVGIDNGFVYIGSICHKAVLVGVEVVNLHV